MENQRSDLNALEFEKAITLASYAAVAWCQRVVDDDNTEDCYLAPLVKAAAWVSRVRRNFSLPPLDLPEMIKVLSKPVSMWLPGGDEMELIHAGEATPICHEYAESAGINPEQEIEQGIMRQIMNNLIGDASGADKYSSFRKFLVENAHALKKDAAAAVQSVGVELSRIYKPIPTASRVQLKNDQEHFFPCPRCKWPMTKQKEKIACAKSSNCMRAGAQFYFSKNRLLPSGQLLPPEPLPCDEYAAVIDGLWRYTVLPGLEELHIFEKIREIPGVEVILYPYIDAYDLDVKVGKFHWRVDVKDYVSYPRLGRHLKDNPASLETWIVVPDRSDYFVKILEQIVPDHSNYRFTSSKRFIQSVKNTAKERKV